MSCLESLPAELGGRDLCTVTALSPWGMVFSQSPWILAEDGDSSGIKARPKLSWKCSGVKAWPGSVQRLSTNSPLGKVRAVMFPFPWSPSGWDVLCGVCCVCLAGSGLGLKGLNCRKAQSLLLLWALEAHNSLSLPKGLQEARPEHGAP